MLEHWPPAPKSIEETGLSLNFIAENCLKALYFKGEMTGIEMSEYLKIPFMGVLEKVLAFLRDEKLVEVKTSQGLLPGNWRHSLVGRGRERVFEILQKDQYSGPLPVPLPLYTEIVRKQTIKTNQVKEEALRKGFAELVISERTLEQLGCALNSAKSIFIYGHAGNGKTFIAEHLSKLLGGPILVPYAIEVDGQIIKIFDPLDHKPVETSEFPKKTKLDERWVLAERPFIVVGGELKLENLNLKYDYESKFYTAPIQLKANGGMLLIDDFGRQEVAPRDLLNRWIIPLEKGVDYLTLHTGKTICIPFDQIIVFSTNLEPRDLVDEAFLRRIRYKIEIPDPTEEMFREIFRRYCKMKNLEVSEKVLDYLIERHYRKTGRGFRSSHPRDLVEQIIDRAKFKGINPEITEETIDYACATYFIGE